MCTQCAVYMTLSLRALSLRATPLFFSNCLNRRACCYRCALHCTKLSPLFSFEVKGVEGCSSDFGALRQPLRLSAACWAWSWSQKAQLMLCMRPPKQPFASSALRTLQHQALGASEYEKPSIDEALESVPFEFKLNVVVTDSAPNELLTQDIARGRCTGIFANEGVQPYFPKLRFAGRDRAHACGQIFGAALEI